MKFVLFFLMVMFVSCSQNQVKRHPGSDDEQELNCQETTVFREKNLIIDAHREHDGSGCYYSIFNGNVAIPLEQNFSINFYDSGLFSLHTSVDESILGAWHAMNTHFYMPLPSGTQPFRIQVNREKNQVYFFLRNGLKIVFEIETGAYVYEESDLKIILGKLDLSILSKKVPGLTVEYIGPTAEHPDHYKAFLEKNGDAPVRSNWKDDGLRVQILSGILLDTKNFPGSVETWQGILPSYFLKAINPAKQECRLQNKELFLPYSSETENYFIPKISDAEILNLIKLKCTDFMTNQ